MTTESGCLYNPEESDEVVEGLPDEGNKVYEDEFSLHRQIYYTLRRIEQRLGRAPTDIEVAFAKMNREKSEKAVSQEVFLLGEILTTLKEGPSPSEEVLKTDFKVGADIAIIKAPPPPEIQKLECDWEALVEMSKERDHYKDELQKARAEIGTLKSDRIHLKRVIHQQECNLACANARADAISADMEVLSKRLTELGETL